MRERSVAIATESIELAAFLKWCGLARTGGEAKLQIQRGAVQVNGVVEVRRSKRLRPGDRVRLAGHPVVVVRATGEHAKPAGSADVVEGSGRGTVD